MEKTNAYASIGVFIDGGYYAKINDALRERSGENISIGALFDYISSRVAALGGYRQNDCVITECHYFRGRYRVDDAAERDLLYAERLFEDTLIDNDVVFHYKHLRKLVRDGMSEVSEKGIDVWFALEAYELSLFRKFDYVVLITGDADHEMLAHKLNAVKIKTVLLTWNVGVSASTSWLLHDEAWYHIELKNECKKNSTLQQKLCYKVE